MTTGKGASTDGRAHTFGGDWTSKKLEVLQKYLRGYTTALKGFSFRKAYIDAFAGTGYRKMRDEEAGADGLLFPDLAQASPQDLLDGSARLALKTEPRFDRHIFIEKNAGRCEQLELLKTEFPKLAERIRVKRGDANGEIRTLCSKDWSNRRAVLFLDPYGMQVEWQTIEAVAKTKAIDLWLLVPLGIGVTRLLTRSGNIPATWRNRLDLFLGTSNWYDEFYRVERHPTLFGTDEEYVIKATNETIGRYFSDRLRQVFADVAEPGVLRNASNCPLFLLCFAAANPKGAPVALRIAEHLLKGIR